MEKQTKTNSNLQILVALAIAALFTVPLKAQKPTYSYFDSLTYRLYENEQWKDLWEAGMNAISHDYDGYYMQIRTGIALFNEDRYRKAHKYLTRAREISPNEVSTEYAYLSKLWSGHYIESEVIRGTLPVSVQERLKITSTPFIKSTELSWGTFFPKKNDATENIESGGEEYGSRLMSNSFSYYSASIAHRLGKRGILNHKAGFLKKHSDLVIVDYTFSTSTYDYDIEQFNYYLRWDASLGKNWSLNLFGNRLWYKYPVFSIIDDYGSNNYGAMQKKFHRDHDFVAGATIIKSFDLADLSLELSGTSIGNENQFQTTAAIVLYPFYNLNFYLGGEFIFNKSASEQHLLSGGTIGGKLSRFLWIEATGMLSDEAHFFHRQHGSLVFNGPELVNYMAGLNAIVLPLKKLKLYLSWQQRGYTSYFTPYDIVTAQQQRPANKNYQLISTSLLWTF